jgi:uncharacterized protein YegL
VALSPCTLLETDMTNLTQVPFADLTFVDNPEPRCPCVLLLDNSGSMAGEPIGQLNAGLKQFQQELASDPLAAKRVEVAIISFGPVRVQQDFVTADQFTAPQLATEGGTPMGEAILEALELIKLRKQQYQANGVAYYRPWIFMITDGAPTDEWTGAAKAVQAAETSKAIAFFPVGVDGADFNILRQISPRTPIKLRGLAFRELFQWLSNSLSGVSKSKVGDALRLPPPDTTLKGWAAIE